MRVLYLNYEWDIRESSGAGTHIAELTRGLVALGHTLVTQARHARPAGNGGRAPSRVRARLSPYLHESAALMRALRGVGPETALIRRERPDVVLTRHSLHQFSSLVAARRAGVPLVFEVNAPLGFEYRRYLRQFHLLPGLAEWTEARTLARADAIFVVSSALRGHLAARGVPAERIAVVPNGADPVRFHPGAADQELRARLGPGRLVVGFVGSFGSFHGIEMLRHAIDRIVPERPDVVFLLVGEGPLSTPLAAYCRERGFGERVVFTGFVPPERVPGAVAAMDVVLAPYAPEPFFYFSPIKLFEYMAAGRAVLAAGIGQIAEVIRDGENGMLYDPGDARAFEDRLACLLRDSALRTRLGQNARCTLERDYTWRANAERVAAVLAEARARAARRPATER